MKFNRLITQYQNGLLHVEYLGEHDQDLVAKIEKIVGRRHVRGAMGYQIAERERSHVLFFEVSPEEAPEVLKRLKEITE